MGEVSVWANNLSRMYRWRGSSRGKPRKNVQMIVGMTISNSQVFCQGFLSEKHSLHFMGNEVIYSVGKEFGKTLFHFAKQRVSWVPREMAFLVKYSRTGQAGITLQLLVMYFTRGLFTGCFTCELLASQSQTALILLLKLDSSPISHTHPLQINPHKYREMIE